jgi:adenylate cyclase
MPVPSTSTDVVTGAIMFTDLVGFTEFTALSGDDAALELLAAQSRLVDEVLPADARVVKELGDGLLLYFRDPAEAVQAGLDLQRTFEAESESTGMPLWIRVGMHAGVVRERGRDLVGHDVNVAARIVDVAGGCRAARRAAEGPDSRVRRARSGRHEGHPGPDPALAGVLPLTPIVGPCPGGR